MNIFEYKNGWVNLDKIVRVQLVGSTIPCVKVYFGEDDWLDLEGDDRERLIKILDSNSRVNGWHRP